MLVATANKDLFDFNPSPNSHRYYGAVELRDLFGGLGFSVRLWGDTPLEAVSLRQRLLRPLKWAAVHLDLMPKTGATKKWLKRLVFGALVRMPA